MRPRESVFLGYRNNAQYLLAAAFLPTTRSCHLGGHKKDAESPWGYGKGTHGTHLEESSRGRQTKDFVTAPLSPAN